jgi:hypothetical protein
MTTIEILETMKEAISRIDVICHFTERGHDLYEVELDTSKAMKYLENEIISAGGEKPLYFRGKKVSYGYSWSDDDTFGFDLGDGEFVDSEDLEYFIRLEYHDDDGKWIVEIWWEDNSINIEELDVSDANEYITRDEIEEVKEDYED